MTKRVLIVDDEPIVLEVLKEFFGCFQHGHRYEIQTARDGTDALMMLLGKRQFDLVLLDIRLPGVSGLDLLDQMRALGLRAPVLVITGNRDSAVAADALKSGVFAYVPKPVDLLHLDHLVALALPRVQHPGKPSPGAPPPPPQSKPVVA